MSRVISMVSPKGGAGKTTMGMVLASELAHRGQTVCFVDADPNKPLYTWQRQGQSPESISVLVDEDREGETIFDTIDAAKDQADWTIVDLEGSPNVRTTRAITEAGLCLIPIRASYLDSAQAARAVKLIKDCSRQARRKIPFSICFTQTKGAVVTRSYKDIGEQIRNQDLPTLPVELVEREAYVKMFALGTTLHGLESRDVSGLQNALENARKLCNVIVQAYANAAEKGA